MLEVAIILGAFRMGIGGLPPLFSRRVEGLIIELWELPAIIVQIFKIRK
jgi:hypothetical protein